MWCLGLAFTIDYAVALGTIALTALLFVYILQGMSTKVKGGTANGDFGDIVQGIRFAWCHSLLGRMVETDAPMKDVALDAGFRDADHFYKVFARVEGLPPTQYRRERQKAFLADHD